MAYSIRRGTVRGPFFQRKCPGCMHTFNAKVTIAQETFGACFECDECRVPIWLQTATDQNYDKFSTRGLKISEIKTEIETLVPPCPNCNRKLCMVDWRLYGAPTRCPKCGTSQKSLTLRELQDDSNFAEVEEEQLWLIGEGAPIPPGLKNSKQISTAINKSGETPNESKA